MWRVWRFSNAGNGRSFPPAVARAEDGEFRVELHPALQHAAARLAAAPLRPGGGGIEAGGDLELALAVVAAAGRLEHARHAQRGRRRRRVRPGSSRPGTARAGSRAGAETSSRVRGPGRFPGPTNGDARGRNRSTVCNAADRDVLELVRRHVQPARKRLQRGPVVKRRADRFLAHRRGGGVLHRRGRTSAAGSPCAGRRGRSCARVARRRAGRSGNREESCDAEKRSDGMRRRSAGYADFRRLRRKEKGRVFRIYLCLLASTICPLEICHSVIRIADSAFHEFPARLPSFTRRPFTPPARSGLLPILTELVLTATMFSFLAAFMFFLSRGNSIHPAHRAGGGLTTVICLVAGVAYWYIRYYYHDMMHALAASNADPVAHRNIIRDAVLRHRPVPLHGLDRHHAAAAPENRPAAQGQAARDFRLDRACCSARTYG